MSSASDAVRPRTRREPWIGRLGDGPLTGQTVEGLLLITSPAVISEDRVPRYGVWRRRVHLVESSACDGALARANLRVPALDHDRRASRPRPGARPRVLGLATAWHRDAGPSGC